MRLECSFGFMPSYFVFVRVQRPLEAGQYQPSSMRYLTENVPAKIR
jgi:hypothetical protein